MGTKLIKIAGIKAEDMTEAFAEAQAQMELTAMNDTALLAQAQQRAQKLLEALLYRKGVWKSSGRH